MAGFATVPILRYEDTQGEPILTRPPRFPNLKVVADAWNITVDYAPVSGSSLGEYSSRGLIRLKSDDAEVFYHELVHAAQDRLGMHKFDTTRLEVSAEACASELCAVYGGDTLRSNQNVGAYIRDYAKRAGQKPEKALTSVLKDCESILNLINQTAEELGVE